jgi:type I restriction enzyme S subunit
VIELYDRGGWVGLSPANWEVGPLRRFCQITLGKMIPGDAASSISGQPYLRAAHVQPTGRLVLTDVKMMEFSPVEARRLKLDKGDVVVVEGGAGYGRSAVLREELTGWGFQNSINRVRPVQGDGRFLCFALLAAQGSGYFETLINTATIPHLTAEKLADVQIAWPSAEQQRQIADYLDRETAKIDTLVEKQERLIETLAERRQAVISHAVTKGLDSKVPMKTPESKWFVQVPAGWTEVPIKRMTTRITDGSHISPETENGEYDFVSTRDVSAQGIDFRGALKTSASSYDYLVRNGCQPVPGDVLFSKDGTVGRTVVITEVRPFVVASSLIIVRPQDRRVDSAFLNYLFQSVQVQEQVRSFVKGAGLPRLSIANLLKIVGVFPPRDGQDTIVKFLDEQTSRLDALSAKAREMIAVLKERRQALISAAVTGKIDVRGLF